MTQNLRVALLSAALEAVTKVLCSFVFLISLYSFAMSFDSSATLTISAAGYLQYNIFNYDISSKFLITYIHPRNSMFVKVFAKATR